MLDIFNRKKLAKLEADLADARYYHVEAYNAANHWRTKYNDVAAELTAIKEKQRENSRKGALAANAKRRAEREKANA